MATTRESYANQTSDVEQRVRAAGAQIGDKASELAAKAGDQFEQVKHSAEETARNMAEQGREAGERVQQVAGNMKTAVDKSVREQPMATLAVAAALGFVLGALWKS
ncbi:MAG: YqjD family protein [Hyphomicrobiaceae bacterium]